MDQFSDTIAGQTRLDIEGDNREYMCCIFTPACARCIRANSFKTRLDIEGDNRESVYNVPKPCCCNYILCILAQTYSNLV